MQLNVWQLFSEHFATEPSSQALIARVGYVALLVIGMAGLAVSGRGLVEVGRVLRSEAIAAEMPRSQVTTAPQHSVRPVTQDRDFVAELPTVAPSDLQIRYAAKLAHEQRVVIVQMQFEPLKAVPKALGQSRLTLQLRGDYRDIKNVWIALLEKYPGLVLERLSLIHHADELVTAAPKAAVTAVPPRDRSDDEASVEMIQYTQPAGVSR